MLNLPFPFPPPLGPSPSLYTISLRRKLSIRNIIHQLPQLRPILNLDPRNPPLTLRPVVNSARLLLQKLIRPYDLPRHGCHDIRCGLDRLHRADGVAGADFEVEGGEFDEDDVAEVFGCVD